MSPSETPIDSEPTNTPEPGLKTELRLFGWHMPWPDTIRALRHRNYRLFWLGQLVSLIGTWMQTMALGWLIAEIAERSFRVENSSFYLGLNGMLGSLPVMILCLFAGAVADRHDKRRILLATQSALLVLALMLGILAGSESAQFWHVILISMLIGVVHAFDMPTRQSFVKDLAGKEDLTNAIALNSSVFNGARIVGAAIAGIIMHSWMGLPGVFVLNALSYIAVIAGLLAIRHRHVPPPADHRNIFRHLGEGFRYVAGQRTLRLILLTMGIYSIFGFSYAVLLPSFVRYALNAEIKVFSWLLMSAGFGAFLGAIRIAHTARYARKGRSLLTGGLCFSLGLMAFGFTRHIPLLCFLLAIVGFGLVTSNASINSLIQHLAPDHMRGRIVSMWAFIFAGFSPIGSLYAGSIGQWTSPSFAIFLGGAICLALIVALSIFAPWIWRER